MKFGRLVVATAATIGLVLIPASAQSVPAPADAVSALASGGGQPDSGLCRPGQPDPAPPTTVFYGGNKLLGPAQLPLAAPVGPLLTNYQRFGALDSVDFLNQYGTVPNHDAYTLPPANGFVLQANGLPIKFAQQLQTGFRIDRFGSIFGFFLSPLGTPFAQRGLSPVSLNTPEPTDTQPTAPLSNYHVYCVLKPFTVDTGPITQWFAEPSLGTQYKLESKYIPGSPDMLNVKWLLENNYLVEERPPSN